MKKSKYHAIPIVDYLLLIGEPIEQISNGYYAHKNHDSLKINLKHNYFTWNSRHITGGVIQYLMAMYDMTKEQARIKVSQDLKGGKIESVQKEQEYLESFTYTEEEQPTTFRAHRYLVKERMIPNRIVKQFIETGLIRESVYQEVIFKWIKNQCVVGYSKQGTVKLTKEQQKRYRTERAYFKYIAPTTEEDTYWGFNYLVGQPKNIYFFESAIDLLSYYTLYESELHSIDDFWLVSYEGLGAGKEKTANFLRAAIQILKANGADLESLHCCFDNDMAGREFYDYLALYHYQSENGIVEFTNDLPPKRNEKNDWNEEMRFLFQQKIK